MGTPTDASWPEAKYLTDWSREFPRWPEPPSLRHCVPGLALNVLDLLQVTRPTAARLATPSQTTNAVQSLLVMNPSKRISASRALEHPCMVSELARFTAEESKRLAEQQERQERKAATKAAKRTKAEKARARSETAKNARLAKVARTKVEQERNTENEVADEVREESVDEKIEKGVMEIMKRESVDGDAEQQSNSRGGEVAHCGVERPPSPPLSARRPWRKCKGAR